jgi:hypothetical protein
MGWTLAFRSAAVNNLISLSITLYGTEALATPHCCTVLLLQAGLSFLIESPEPYSSFDSTCPCPKVHQHTAQ